MKIYVLGTHQKCLAVMLLMRTTAKAHLVSTHNKIFCRERRKLFIWISFLSKAMSMLISQHTTNLQSDLCDQQRFRSSACVSAQSIQSSLIACAFYSLRAIQRGINENPCHTWWMYRLIRVFAGSNDLIVGFVRFWLIYILLSTIARRG